MISRALIEMVLHGASPAEVLESAATPMPVMNTMPKAGTMARSMRTTPVSSQPSTSTLTKIPSILPQHTFPSKFPTQEMIDRVVRGESPASVVEQVLTPQEFERRNSSTSPYGSPVDPDMLRPGSYIGIHGPVHEGHHAVVAIKNGMVTLKNEQAHEFTIPLEDLRDHEIFHNIINV